MYSVMVGCSPQTGQSGSRRSVTSLNSVESASKRSRRPESDSPMPSASFSVSFAWSEPMIPGSTPSTPPSAQLGAAPCRGEIERGGRAETAGADQEDARLEQLQLSFFPDLGNQQMAAVARALLRVEDARELRRKAVALPVREAARERDDVLVPELLERFPREGRPVAGLAVEDDRPGPTGRGALDARPEVPAGHVDAPGKLALVPLVLPAHV